MVYSVTEITPAFTMIDSIASMKRLAAAMEMISFVPISTAWKHNPPTN
jgi:hypothetical protein